MAGRRGFRVAESAEPANHNNLTGCKQNSMTRPSGLHTNHSGYSQPSARLIKIKSVWTAALLCAGFYEAVDGFKRKNDFKAVSLEITSICLFFFRFDSKAKHNTRQHSHLQGNPVMPWRRCWTSCGLCCSNNPLKSNEALSFTTQLTCYVSLMKLLNPPLRCLI